MPADARTRPTEGHRKAGSTSEVQVDETQGNHTAIDLPDEIERVLISYVLAGGMTAATIVTEAMVQVPPRDPLRTFVIRHARAAIADGITPDPVVVTEYARRSGESFPPAFLGAPISALWAMATPEPPVAASAPWWVGCYLANAVRFRVQQTVQVLNIAAWTGDLDDLREIVAREFRALRAAFDAAEQVAE